MTASYHSHAPWRKAILIPFWTLQLGFELLIIGLTALAAGFLNKYFEDTSYIEDGEGGILEVDYSDLDNTEHIVIPIYIAILGVCIILTVTEAILFLRRKLKPPTFLITNIIKSTIWVVLFILEILTLNDTNTRTTSTLAIVIEAILLLCFWIPLVYAGIIYHRFRKDKKLYAGVDHLESDLLPMAARDYPHPPQYLPFHAPESMGSAANPKLERPVSSVYEVDERFEADREHRRSGSDGGERAMIVPIMHLQEHGEAFEAEPKSRISY